MFERIRQMLIKEFIHVLRDPKMKGIIFVMPVIQLIIFGYAVTTDVKQVAIAMEDHDNSIASREFTARLTESGYFNVTERIENNKEARNLMDKGQVKAVFCINKGFEADLRVGRAAQIQAITDGTDSNTASIILDYARKIASQFSKDTLITRISRLSGSKQIPGGVDLQARAWFNENLESRNYFVPGVMAIVVMLVTLMLTSMAVVREKEIGTMEQIIVTPIKPVEFILGKTVPFALIGFADVIIITLVGVLWFSVPIRGNILLLLGAAVLYLMSALGIGLLISTVSGTQQQAMMTAFFFFFPAVLLSGFMFPIRNMPIAIQWLTYINPLRYFLVIIRGIFLKGLGVNLLWPQGMALLAIGGATLWLSSRRFKKTLN